MTIDVSRHRCLILGTDGLWNMIPPQRAVEVVQHIDRQNKMHPNPDQPLVKSELKIINTVCWTVNVFVSLAVDEPFEAPGKHRSGLLDDEQAACG